MRGSNTSNFTLMEHCGGFTAALQKCLNEHGLPNDPLSLNDSAWRRAPDCYRIWSSYRACGREFIGIVDTVRCADEVSSFAACSRSDGCANNCAALESDALRCLGSKIKLKTALSGKAAKPALQ